MHRDFKIGAAIGLLLIGAVSLWLAIQPSLSVKARMSDNSVVDTAVAAPQEAALPQAPAVPQPQVSDTASPDSAQKTAKIHIVRKGENLSMISKQYYGSAAKWQKILDANRSIVKNPNTLSPGTKLTIPD
jgi:nucleoid-associated protein YgaU